MRTATASSLFASATALLALAASAQADGQTAALDSATSYCFFLPPMLGGDIAANEDVAIAFCNAPNSKAPGAKIFPDGFVTSVHWATGDGWVQISGQIDPTKYNLNPCDAGGQYDIKAPVGAKCAGYNYFVNVIEPLEGIYGMRCCLNKADCDVSHSTYGARRVYGATTDFSGPAPDGTLPAALKCVNGSIPGGASSTAPPSSAATPSNIPTTSAAGGNTAATTPSTSAHVSAPNDANSASTSGMTSEPHSAAAKSQVMVAATAVVASLVGFLLA